MSPAEPGTMIVVVGPSGAGKDSLIDYARQRLAGNAHIGFVQRWITRPADAGGEDHLPLALEEFLAMRRDGRFAVSWGAHDLHYGIPAETSEELAAGRTLVANGSRAALPSFLAAYPRLQVVVVTARPEIIAARLKARGRETAESISRRLARSELDWAPACGCTQIDNSGSLETAGDEFTALLTRIAGTEVARAG